ncbi:MAG: type II toxin-antitoxin system VapC family toxin [Deltaproteobacteria bacterium]|nr:type II toxin-antitoxin system VapC family toxin [Deltaproteobacteria bacterium]MBN2673908.1 type II toxin-antitoxin system VapC family toxin [Deltaproteobacteria bacterium]
MKVVLVDTSIWIQHLRGDAHAAHLNALLADGVVGTHPWVIGELALGNLGRRRPQILHDIGMLLHLPVISVQETMAMIEHHRLAGTGIGWVDAQLVASALVADAALWTTDRRLSHVSCTLGVEFLPH